MKDETLKQIIKLLEEEGMTSMLLVQEIKGGQFSLSRHNCGTSVFVGMGKVIAQNSEVECQKLINAMTAGLKGSTEPAPFPVGKIK